MDSIVVSVDFYHTPMGHDTPDFKTNLTIYSDGTFQSDGGSDGRFAERGTLRSWLYEVSPNGTDCLTIHVPSNIAQFYDQAGPQVKGVIEFLEKYLPNIRTTNQDYRYTPGI